MFGFLLALGMMSSTRSNDRRSEAEYQQRLANNQQIELLKELAKNTKRRRTDNHTISNARISSYMLRK